VETDLARIITERFRQDRDERHLYGDSVVDAYIDLQCVWERLQRRLHNRPIRLVRQMAYYIVAGADKRGFSG